MKLVELILHTIISMLGAVPYVAGECLYNGKLYMNHTLWLPNHCTICTCVDPVSVCEQVRCLSPNCDFKRGEYLQVPSDGCCPECVQHLTPCQYQSQTIPHNTDWNPEPCTQCLCWDSRVTCSAEVCPDTRCKPGEVSQTLPGNCCPQCIPSGRSCLSAGVRYEDGQEWSPIPCTKCVCRDGQSTCYPIQCTPTVCSQGQTMERRAGDCCPVCMAGTCTDGTDTYKDKAQWQRSPCTFCTCMQGQVVCRDKECVKAKDMECMKNEVKVTREGECCLECVSAEDACNTTSPVRYSGDIWNTSACEFCLCKEGHVSCYTASCGYIKCRKNEVEVKLPGKCCPECIQPPRCQSAGQVYTDGDTWHPDPCTVCNCQDGEIVCYRTPCPVCSEGNIAVVQQGECCGKCLPLQCGDSCLRCTVGQPDYCTECLLPGLLIQDGQCVQQCYQGHFPTRAGQCQACHSTCESCSGDTEYHCLTCKAGLLWKNGQCVVRCSLGYFQEQDKCVKCHSSCSYCLGQSHEQCLSCVNPGQLLQKGQCVNSCHPQFFVKNGVCVECEPTCKSCSTDGRVCKSCHINTFLHQGQCLIECPDGFHGDRNGVCVGCHPSCRTCNGTSDTDCLSCHTKSTLSQNGRCLMPCPEGQFVGKGGKCKNCEPGCMKCQSSADGRGSMCTQCSSPQTVAFADICVRKCPIGHYNDSGICGGCIRGCASCQSPSLCTRCGPALLLADGVCVQNCGPAQYIDEMQGTCVDCADHCLDCTLKEECTQCDNTTYLKDGYCVRDCGPHFFKNTETRQCDENKDTPSFHIYGQVQLEEGGITEIPAEIFSLYDGDTPKSDLVLVIVQPPVNGELLKVGMGRDITLSSGDAFTIEDLKTGRIRFAHVSGSNTKNQIILKATDRQLESRPQTLYIQAVPKFAPHLTKHNPLVTHVGEVTTLGPDHFDISMKGRKDTVSIKVLEGPSHGSIINRVYRVVVQTFSVKDFYEGNIAYSHDGKTAADTDMVLLQISDGYHLLNFILYISIRQKEDTLPMLINNKMGHVNMNEMFQITSDLLLAKPMDRGNTPSNDVIYTLVPPTNNPMEGELIMVVHQPADGPGRGWEDMGEGKMSAKMFRFLQRDIDEGRIWYKHMGASAKADTIRFEVSDTSNPPNILKDQEFHITVVNGEKVTIAVPTLAPGARLGMTILENQVVPISKSNLAFQDLDSADSDITYSVVRPLGPEDGTLEHVQNPFVSISRFTQDDVNNNRIIYRPPLKEIGTDEKEFFFTFLVSDGSTFGGIDDEQTFYIRVLPVNNEPPRFLNLKPSVKVTEGGSVPIGQGLLAMSDPDTRAEELMLTLIEPPHNGRFEKVYDGSKRVTLQKGEEFEYREFLEGVFHYSHTPGSALWDRFQLQVSDGSHTSSVVVSVDVIRVDRSAPVLLPTAVGRIDMYEGETILIQRKDIGFRDMDEPDSRLHITLTSKTSHGKLHNKGGRQINTGMIFTQQNINDDQIQYTAEKEIGIQPVTEDLTFNVSDSSGNVLPNQILSIIISPVDNQPPVVTVGSNLLVEEGKRVQFRRDSIKVTDADSKLSSLVVYIKEQPRFGQIINPVPDMRGSERTQRPRYLSTFPIQDLIDGNIYYHQTKHEGVEPTSDYLVFYVTDGINKSPEQNLNISIQLVNDEAPVLATEQLFVKEDESVLVTNSSIYVIDLDTEPHDLIFTVDKAPLYGELGRRDPASDDMLPQGIFRQGTQFTYKDVIDGLVVYHHTGGDVKSDKVVLTVSDGEFTDTNTLTVVIGVINDETPRVTINRGLRVHAGSTTPIKSQDLQATDVDSDNSQILYTIKRDPTAGALVLDRGDNPQTVSVKGPVKSFRQEDINRGFLSYTHSANQQAGVVTFKFDVEDPEGNPLIDQIFFITVMEDRIPPEVVTKKTLVVREGSQTKITTHYLSYTDVDSDPGALRYFLITAPELGHLELIGQPGVPMSEFTQSDLAANRLVYKHTSSKEIHMDSFKFTVTDGTNEVTQVFFITITPVDDEIPVVTNNGLRVQEGIRKIITPFDLKAVDEDTQENSLTFTIVLPPIHGHIEIQDDKGFSQTSTFTMADISENRVSYQHDGSDTQRDSFAFTVTDGVSPLFSMQMDGRRGDISVPSPNPSNFRIQILPVDDGTPVLETNLGLQFLEQSSEGVYNMITSRDLFARDEDTEPGDIVFMITSAPLSGHIELTTNPGVPVTSFTQEDINNQIVRYVLTTVTEATRDSFTFDLMDSKPNRVPDNVFHIMWSVIEFEQTVMNVSETAGVVKVPIIRRGNLNQYSILTCRTIQGSAKSSPSSLPGSQDFQELVGQVQFDEWQDTKVCTIVINDDSIYEGLETLHVELTKPVYALIGRNKQASITIHDQEDEPVIEFQQPVYFVNETDRYLTATLVRKGDVSTSVSVICYTVSMSARGSSLTGLESGSDYITRGRTNAYRVVFPPGVTTAVCDVKIIDDSDSENSEQFEMLLADPSMDTSIGPVNSATVTIRGPNDESHVHFSSPDFSFPENITTAEVEVVRDGSDLSHTTVVWCATQLSNPPSATPGQDYLPSSSQITFHPGQKTQKCRLTIVDDLEEPVLEGDEKFMVWLSSALGSNLIEPHTAEIVIQDSQLDVPVMQFESEACTAEEQSKSITVPVVRVGDLTHPSSVICYTRQNSARVMMDYEERPLTNASRIVFLSGQKIQNCTVGIVDDSVNEPDEVFYLRLTEARGSEGIPARVGVVDKTTITITNPEDVPTIQFEESAYTVHEPTSSNKVQTLTVMVIRTGDLKNTSRVRCSTRDGSAHSGIDYSPKSLVLHFKPGEAEKEFSIGILYNSAIEWHESFSVVLGPEEPSGAVLGPNTMTTVTVLDDEVSGSLVLPAPPVVVSLLYYDDVDVGMTKEPTPGYPLVCVTPCDPHYPSYTVTHSMCQDTGINQSAIVYRWEVAMPTTSSGSRPPFVMVTDNTIFTSVDKIVLDSIYFRPFFKVRCIAQPLHENGNPGIPIKSEAVRIGSENGICNAPVFQGTPNSYGAQSFLATLDYVGPADKLHPNTIHINIKIPHQDGHLPLISTYPLHNLRFLLADPVYRQQHLCSNIITPEERSSRLQSSFLDSEDMFPSTYNFAYQFDSRLRENRTIGLYRHLDLKSCVWTFSSYYHMADLVDVCGGKIISDFQVKEAGQTYLTIQVPLYVYYVYATAPVGWGSLQHHTEMEFSFYYDTVLWRSELETVGEISGDLQILKILVGRDGKLVVDFKTHAKFRGLYVLEHDTLPGVTSQIFPPEDMPVTFDLAYLWGQQSYDSPHQLWRATSDYSLKDYTGRYTIELIPCTVKSSQIFISGQDYIPCTAQNPQRFEVPIAFQQSNRPVPLVYSLDTDFQITSNKEAFLSDPSTNRGTDIMDDYIMFSPGQKVYGRVLWNPSQDLKTAYKLSIEKVYLCTGSDGYIPTYDPQGEVYGEGPQFGCIQPSPKLKYRFLLLDKGDPDVIAPTFNNIPFEAEFAGGSVELSAMENMPGVDGFSISVDPLYKVTSGYQWYLQVIYLITKSDSSRIHLHSKRSVISHVSKRDTTSQQATNRDLQTKGNNSNGTNMVYLPLQYSPRNPPADTTHNSIVPIAVPIIVVLVLMVTCVVFVIVCKRRRRGKHKEEVQNNLEIKEIDDSANLLTNLAYQKRNSQMLSLSRVNVSVTEIKNMTVHQSETDKNPVVKIKNTNLKSQGKYQKSGTEV